MGAFAADLDEPILRIPPTSPSRRDYQLRSVSPSPSRPQSPWRPREQVSSQEVDTFRLYESYPPALARSNYYSGPLPSAPQGVDRSFYSGPLPGAPQGVDRSYYSGPLPTITPPSQPSFSGPLSGFSTTTTESFDFEFSTWAKIYHRQHDSSSVPGSPEVGSSQEGKSVRGRYDDDAESVEDEPSKFYLSNPAESRARAAAEFAERAGKYGGSRNCVSGELGISEAIAKQKFEVARGYKSGEILGLNICADGIYTSSPLVADVVDVDKHQHVGATAAWDALMNDAKNDISNAKNDKSNPKKGDPNTKKGSSNAKSDNSNGDSEMVAIPFKWEGVAGKAKDSASKKPNSRTSSTSTKPNSRTSSTSTKPNSRTFSTSTVSQKPNSRTSSTSTVSQKPSSRTSSIPTVPKKPSTQTSSTSTQEVKGSSAGVKYLKSEFSFGGSHKFYGAAATASEKAESVREEAENVSEKAESRRASEMSTSDVVGPPALKPLRTSNPPSKATQQQEEVPKSPFSVPFKWEDEPGKAKPEVEAKNNPEELAPALQLPPRLASASVKSIVKSTVKSRSLSSSTKPSKTSTKQSRSGSVSESEATMTSSVGNHSQQGSGIPSSKKFFDKDYFRRCRRLLVNLF
jgi:hypothetical protein